MKLVQLRVPTLARKPPICGEKLDWDNMNNMNGDLGSDIIYRPATLDDYKDVVAIDENVYDGYDYLPFTYHTMIQDPHCTAFVAIKDGKVVAFNGLQVVDGGKSVIGVAARTAPAYRSQGIYGVLRHLLAIEAARRFPNLKYLVFTTTDKHINLQATKRHDKMGFVMEQHAFQHSLNVNQHDGLLQKLGDSGNVIRLTKSEAKNVLLDPENRWKLFPNGRLTVEWKPYRLEESNVKVIVESAAEVLCVRATEPHASSEECQSISIANIQQLKAAIGYYVSIYSRSEMDLITHVYGHLSLIWKHVGNNKNIAISFFIPVHFDASQFGQKLKDIFDKEGREPKVCMFEGRLTSQL